MLSISLFNLFNLDDFSSGRITIKAKEVITKKVGAGAHVGYRCTRTRGQVRWVFFLLNLVLILSFWVRIPVSISHYLR